MAIDPRKRNKIIVYVGIGISIASVLVVLIVGGILIFGTTTKPANSNGVIVTTTPSNIVSPTPEVTVIAVNNSAMIAIKVDGQGQNPGSLWQVDPTNLAKKVLVSEKKIIDIFSWSPDNNYLALTMLNETNQVVFGVYDKTQNKLLASNLRAMTNYQIIWKGSTDLAVVDSTNKLASQLFSITLPQMNIKILSLGTTHTADLVAINSELTYAILVSGTKIYLFDSTNSTLHDLVGEQVLPGAEFNLGNWIDTNRLVYYTADGLYVLDSSNKTAKRLLTIRSSNAEPYNSKTFQLSADKEDLYFAFSSKLFSYNFGTRNNKELFDLKTQTDLLGEFAYNILPNKLGAVLSGKNKSYLLEFATKKLDTLCETSCQDVAVEN